MWSFLMEQQWCSCSLRPTSWHLMSVLIKLCSVHHETTRNLQKRWCNMGYIHLEQHQGIHQGRARKRGSEKSLWQDKTSCLRDPTNKQELFVFLSNKIAAVHWPKGKEIVITSGVTAVLRGAGRCMPPYDHEKTDTRLLIQLQDALVKGLVCTVDTCSGDPHWHISSPDHPLSRCIWVAFGTGKSFTYYQISGILGSLSLFTSS